MQQPDCESLFITDVVALSGSAEEDYWCIVKARDSDVSFRRGLLSQISPQRVLTRKRKILEKLGKKETTRKRKRPGSRVDASCVDDVLRSLSCWSV